MGLINIASLLYGYATCSLTLREECRLRVFENRMLRRIFGPERDENGEWRRLHNEELHSLYRSPNIVRVVKYKSLRWILHVARMEESSPFLTGKQMGNRSQGRHMRRWEDNIRIDPKIIDVNKRNWINYTQDRDY